MLRPDGTWAQIESVEQREGGAKVYNFEVVQNHNYFVGEQGTLVHNTCNESGSSTYGTGQTAGGISRTTTQWRERYGPASMREHHLIPQAMLNQSAFMQRLTRLGVTDAKAFIDRFISVIPNVEHNKLHLAGWNRQWLDWLDANPHFTKAELEAQVKTMMREFNVPKSSRNYVRSYGKN